ncbi:MAG: DUF642 domain-containing protein, partial [Chloroflexi bacterium]|nr:DUF642 domain-containing protein [Chloroflexota bacterium]
MAGNTVDIVSETYAPSYVAFDGVQTIDMAGTPGPASLYQDLATNAGEDYVVTFTLSSNGGAKANSVTLEWGGNVIDTLNSPAIGTWETHSYTLTATSQNTRIELIGNLGGNAGALLDLVI